MILIRSILDLGLNLPSLNILLIGDLDGVRNTPLEHVSSFVLMGSTAEKHVDLLKRNLFSLRDEEVDIDAQHKVHRHEEVQALETLVGEELGEELLEDGVCNLETC